MWTPNLMHNMIKSAAFTANDIVIGKFDNYFMDFWAAFTVPQSKAAGYNFMIGNQTCLTTPQVFLPATELNVPLPFYYSRDSGLALPTAALPYNDLRIELCLRDISELLVIFQSTGVLGEATSNIECKTLQSFNSANCDIFINKMNHASVSKYLSICQVWANYGVVSNNERQKMGCAPRDMLIERPFTYPGYGATGMEYQPDVLNCGNVTYDLRFSHAVKALFFAVRNVSCPSLWSHYGTGLAGPKNLTAAPLVIVGGADLHPFARNVFGEGFSYNSGSLVVGAGVTRKLKICGTEQPLNGAVDQDPIAQASLLYENTARLSQMGANDYFGMVQPYYHACAIPNDGNLWNVLSDITKNTLNVGGASHVGLHMYSYSLDFCCLDPMGSTNYGKLTNVSINCVFSDAAVESFVNGWVSNTQTSPVNLSLAQIQKYKFIAVALTNNILRASGGALGFPVL